ncbi:MAG: hypothetical protein N2449_06520 [Bacteroidales bacterium]|nr:hypothetical protein [Bacteroidales bacterium]
MEKKTFERPVIKKVQIGMPSKFGLKSEYAPIKEIDGIPVKNLIEQYGSPLYVISEQTIRETYTEAYKAFSTRYPKVQFAWSYKTNYLDAVCKIFHQEGSWAEVVSGFEYEKALNNGVPGNKIIFNGPYKTREDLIKAIENNSFIHIDHYDEYYLLIDLAEELNIRPKVAVRINMDTGIYPQWSRFGFNYENGEAWEIIQRILISNKLDLVGLHCHIGTYIMVPWAYANAMYKLIDLFLGVEKKYNKHLQYIDIGGGFASKNTLKGAYLPGTDTCPTFDQYADAITSVIINSSISIEHLPVLILETGRALIDDAGYLLGTIHATKRLPDGKNSLITDLGVNLLFTSFWYDHKITPAQEFGPYTEETVVYGPLCMNIDVIREYVQLPPLKKGDHFVISRIGAYNMTQWMQFITYRPNVVLIDTNKNTHIIRKAETINNFNNLEQTPEHLKKIE